MDGWMDGQGQREWVEIRSKEVGGEEKEYEGGKGRRGKKVN